MIHARYHGIGVAPVERRVLLPLDLALLEPQQPRQPPLHNLDAVALHEKLMAEYVFALLTEAAVESLACENAARLAVMASARENIMGKLEQLRRGAHQARQSEITTEILDLVSATQTLADHRPPTGRARTPT